MRTDLFDFDLPEELIAQEPLQDRVSCRLLVLDQNGLTQDRSFGELPHFLSEGDLLILNDTKVFPARFTGTRRSGAPLDILLVRQLTEHEWEIMSKGSYSGPLMISDSLSGNVMNGNRIRFHDTSSLHEQVWAIGKMPLPPYIKRKADANDLEYYQTVYAEKEGSIAAPTAGLHFTHDLLATIKDTGVKIAFITLHVGTGTFKPLKADILTDHTMDSEYFEISHSLVEDIHDTHARGKKVIAVGTTTTRALEGLFSGKAQITSNNGTISGSTDIYIYPGYEFRAINTLVTNMHLPRSTPLLLTAALAGRDALLSGYREAVRKKYRFFSYGDAMLIL